jgi:hypothetical protein
MDALMSQVLRLGSTAGNVKALMNALDLAEKAGVLTPVSAVEMLRMIDPVLHSLAYLYCL